MDFSLDNPGFSDTISSMQDAPKSSGSSSASSAPPQRSCAKCPARMSSIDRGKHLICVRCWGYECSVELRCKECKSWSKEEMLSHEKIRKSLASKSKGRGKSSDKSAKKPASPPSTSAQVDLDVRFEAQYDSMVKEMDERMELLSSSLLGQIISLFDSRLSHDPSSYYTSAFPGQAGVHAVPEPPQLQAKSAVKNRERLVCEGGTGAQALGLTHAQGSVSNQLGQDQAAHPPGFRGDSQDVPSGSRGPRGHREYFSDDDFLEDEDDDDMDDRNSLAEASVDRTFAHLIDYIYHLRLRLPQLRDAIMKAFSLLRSRLSHPSSFYVFIRGWLKFSRLLEYRRQI